jgi:hypothetical protein
MQDMRTRRELLVIGGAGAAAIAVPSFFPTTRSIALAQGNSGDDPMLREIARQTQRMVAALRAHPPRGNARQLAAVFRMGAAWAKANKLDAVVRQRLDSALASEGHHVFVTRLAGTDYRVVAQKLGISPQPNMHAPDATVIAKAIGLHKAGYTYELAWRIAAQHMDRKAEQFDRHMAIANGRRPTDATIRLIQDPVCGDPDCSTVEYEPTGDCTQNPDGSFSCNFVANGPSPTTPSGDPPPTQEFCNGLDWLGSIFQGEYAILAALIPEIWFIAILFGIAWETWEWYVGC